MEEEIETLGLEVRASKENPSTINGEWNPRVLANLEKRLADAGIDPKWEVVRQIRAPSTRLLKKHRLGGKKASWSRGNVRDRMVPVTNAIGQASFLRSKVAAHAANTLTQSLSVYDVNSVQMLARCLLLYAMGI